MGSRRNRIARSGHGIYPPLVQCMVPGNGGGKAEFAKAEQNRKIKIEEAKANLEAEKLNAQAEIERAKGAAEAIPIENGSITPTYIQYLWVRQQSDLSDKTVIYVPTETNLPILESTRRLSLSNKNK